MHTTGTRRNSSEPPPRSGATSIICAIPARYASTRLPGKPLLLIDGQPMIEHVYRRASAAEGIDKVVVLTDDERIAAAVDAFGGEWEMTPADCASGTDRIAGAAIEWQADAIINVQGDEPLLDPNEIALLAAFLRDHPETLMSTLAAEATTDELHDPNTVKVVIDQHGNALYFSRAPVPYPRNPDGAPAWRHIGMYGYQRSALLELAALAPSPLERREGLEQLRALENGMIIRVLTVAGRSFGVDTEDDLRRARELVEERPSESSKRG